MPSLDPRWLLLMGILLLIFAAFMAGLYYMIAQLCVTYLDQKKKAPTEPVGRDALLGAFGSFRHFLPGVGGLFWPVTVGYLIQFGFLALLVWWLRPLWQPSMPLVKQLGAALMAGASEEKLVNALTMPQQLSLGQLGVAMVLAGLVYAIFSMLVMLWPVFTVMYEESPLKAYGRSLMQFFRDPLRLLALSLLFFVVKMAVLLVTMMGGVFLDVLGRLLLLLLEIFMTIALFVYAYLAVGRPVLVESKDSPSESDVSGNPPAV